jgi:hypothetical protein
MKRVVLPLFGHHVKNICIFIPAPCIPKTKTLNRCIYICIYIYIVLLHMRSNLLNMFHCTSRLGGSWGLGGSRVSILRIWELIMVQAIAAQAMLVETIMAGDIWGCWLLLRSGLIHSGRGQWDSRGAHLGCAHLFAVVVGGAASVAQDFPIRGFLA